MRTATSIGEGMTDDATLRDWTRGWVDKVASLIPRPLSHDEVAAVTPLARKMAEAPKDAAAMALVWAELAAVLPDLRRYAVSVRQTH